MNKKELKSLLDKKVAAYNQVHFINNDPVCIPHMFSKKQDIEIAGFFAAIIAWGQRKTIINNAKSLMQLMDNSPHDFIVHHQDSDLIRFKGFVHRTFNETDLLYCLYILQRHYQSHKSLENMFLPPQIIAPKVEQCLSQFHTSFFNSEYALNRTKKHIATPQRKSACKRLNMYLRWMVRKDDNGVDFGLWNGIKMADLICPLDVHVERVARAFKLLNRKQTDWLAAVELTNNLSLFDKHDPVKYDYALFGLGLESKGL